MQGVLDDYRGLRVGSSFDATGHEFHVGHLRLYFRSGTLTSVLTKSGLEAGFIYSGGEGHYSYTSEDANDLQSLGQNIREFVSTSAYREDGVLSEEMKGCVVLASQPVLPEILNTPAGPGGQAAGGAASRLSTFLKAADEADIGLDHELALSRLGSPPGRLVYAEIDGQTVDPGYLFDPVVRQEERLLLFRTFQGNRILGVMSRQNAGADQGKSTLVVTALDYSLDTANNKDATVKIVQTFSVQRTTGRLVPFHLVNHTDRTATSWQSTKRTIDVTSVKTPDGRALPFSHRYHTLLVELPEAPTLGSALALNIELTLHSLDTRGDEYYVVNAGVGFPAPWGENPIHATSHWKVTTKKPYRAFTGGTVVARREEGDRMFLEARVDHPTSFLFLIAGKFDVKETDRNGLKVRVGIYGTATARAVQSYTEAAYTLLDVYGKALVPYPRKDLDILEFKYLGAYQSPAGLVVLPTEPPGGNSVVESRRLDFHLRTFMHELAHQWFGNLVTPKSWAADNWISESIAEYLGALVYSKGAKTPKDSAQLMQMAIDDWRRRTDMSKNSVSIAQAARLYSETDEYYQLLYGRGPLVVRMLHATIGDDPFWQLLTNVLTKYANKEISTEDFARETSAIAGHDMGWFFRQWIESPGIPDLETSKSITRSAGKTIVSGHLKQRDAAHFKILVLPFVYESKGARKVTMVTMEKPEQDFSVELPPDASRIELDPDRSNLVYYH